MKREAELRRRLQALHTLGEAVRGMKSLSAHHFRAAREAVESMHVYRRGVERILRQSDAALAGGDGPAGLLIVGAELGLCGAYNAEIVEAGLGRKAELGDGPLLCVGRRAAIRLSRRGLRPDRIFAGPTSIRGVTSILLHLAEEVLTTYASERLSVFWIVSSRFAGVGSASPESTRLLPLESASRAEPGRVRYVSSEHFATAVMREFLYATLYGLLLDALAAEHGARLVATQATERWLDEREEKLGRQLNATRREASTQEVIEIAAGARARSGARRSDLDAAQLSSRARRGPW